MWPFKSKKRKNPQGNMESADWPVYVWYYQHDPLSDQLLIYHEGAVHIDHLKVLIKDNNQSTLMYSIEELGPCMTITIRLSEIALSHQVVIGMIEEVIIIKDKRRKVFQRSGNRFISDHLV